MAKKLRQNVPGGGAAASRLAAELDAIAAGARSAAAGRVGRGRVHALRRSARLAEVATVLLGGGSRHAQRLLKRLARVRRKAGAVRDLDITQALLRKEPGDGARWLRRRVERERREAGKRLVAFGRAHPHGGVRGAWTRFVAGVRVRPGVVARRRRALEAAFRKLERGRPRDARELHRLRIAGRAAAMAWEVLGVASARLGPLRTATGRLGKVHDLTVAARTAWNVIDGAGRKAPEAARRAAERLDGRASRAVAAESRRWPGAGRAL